MTGLSDVLAKGRILSMVEKLFSVDFVKTNKNILRDEIQNICKDMTDEEIEELCDLILAVGTEAKYEDFEVFMGRIEALLGAKFDVREFFKGGSVKLIDTFGCAWVLQKVAVCDDSRMKSEIIFEFENNALQLKNHAVMKSIISLALSLNRRDIVEKCVKDAFGDKNAFLIPKKKNKIVLPSIAKNEEIKLSILCTAYNHQEYIGRALSGFFEQAIDAPFEVLVSDDASTDDTYAEIMKWKRHFPKIIKVFRFRKNIYSTGRKPFEVLLSRARGKYIARCEGDDFWLDPKKIAIQLGALDEFPNFNSCTHNFFKLDYNNLSLTQQYHKRSPEIEPAIDLQYVKRLLWLPTLVFRRNFSALPPEHFASPIGDYLLTSYLGNFGGNIHLSDLMGSVQRKNPYSVWFPLDEAEKDRRRWRARYAIHRMNSRLGNLSACKRNKIIMDRISINAEDRAMLKSQVDELIARSKLFKLSDLEYDVE